MIEDGVPQCASSERQFGAFREGRWHARDTSNCRGKPGRAPQHVQACLTCSTGRVSSRFSEGGGKLDRRRARGVLNPCAIAIARIKGANRGGSERKADLSPQLSSYGSQQGAAHGQDFRHICHECSRLWTDGCWLGRQLHRLKASAAMDLSTTFFFISARYAALKNLDLFIKTDRSVICPRCCSERWPWVDDSNPSRSGLLSI